MVLFDHNKGRITNITPLKQVNTLNLVGVSHLFIVPRLRSSHYTFLLSGAFPALRDSPQGNIQEAALPHLRNLVVVNNTSDVAEFRKELHGLKSAIDWRDIIVWQEDAKERKKHQEIQKTLKSEDIINLQFTRFGVFSLLIYPDF